MQLGAIDHILTQQALITGEIRDALTGQPPLSLPTVILLSHTPSGDLGLRFPLTARRYHDGRFVFPGAPTTAFPRLSPGSTLDLLLRVSAVRYQTKEIQLNFSNTDLDLIDESLEIDGREFPLKKLRAPLAHQIIELLPEPLHLNGRIVELDNPETPIANAEVSIIEPELIGPRQTDTNGYFTFYNLPVVKEVHLQVQHIGFEPLEDKVITLDYRQPVNQITYALAHS